MIDLRQEAVITETSDDVLVSYEKRDEAVSNEELLRKIQNNDLPYDAFSKLVKTNNKRFYILAYRLVGNKEDAEDIVQNCFMRIWHASDLWDESKGAKFTTWFTRVVINECRMNFRKSKRNAAKPDEFSDYTQQEEIISDKAGSGDEVVEGLDKKQKLNLVKDAINDLPDRQREALILCFYEEMSNKEAAEIMEINVKALESLLMRAKKQLKEMFNNGR